MNVQIDCKKDALLNKQLPHPENKWDMRFAWLWYNDEEIFRDSEEDIDRKVKKIADEGINHVITFSCTHFRWSFRRHWPLLTEVLSKIVRSCHRHNIYVTEHHSAHLMHCPDESNSFSDTEKWLNKRHSSIASWSNLIPDCLEGFELNGHTKASFLQINGKTGKPLYITGYKANGMCFNNPFYQTEYFKYLESLYATGIDGIMTDDVQYFENSCTCKYCREKFNALYGHKIPSPENWDAFFNNYNSEIFRAWLDFRFRSTERFHADVKKHYEGLGLNLLRPNYCSSCLNLNESAYCFDTLPATDWGFQECCYSTIIRYSWPYNFYEQSHRVMVAKNKNIPAMIMTYADRQDTLEFTWALAMCTGSLYTNTPEGELGCSEKEIRDFEKKHASLLFDNEKMASVAFCDSKRNRELNPEYYASRIRFWMQSCIFENIQFDLVSVNTPEKFGKYKILILNELALLSEVEIEDLKKFTLAGGILIISGCPGLFDTQGKRRTIEEINNLWGFKIIPDLNLKDDSIEINNGTGKIVLINYNFGYPGEDDIKEKLFVSKPNSGTGEFIDFCTKSRQEIVPYWATRWNASKAYGKYDGKFQNGATERKKVTDLIRKQLANNIMFDIDGVPELVIASPFITKDRQAIIIHLLNASEIFDIPSGAQISHDDRIPFPKFDKDLKAKISVKKTAYLRTAKVLKIKYITLHNDQGIDLKNYMDDGDFLHIEFPLSLLEGYGVIIIN